MTTFSKQEVAKHNSKGDLWFVIHDKVYNITKFVDEHPGGEEVLFEHAGGDATEAFEDVGHSEDARALLKDYFVGGYSGGGLSSSGAKNVAYTAGKDGKPTVSTNSGTKWLYVLVPLAIAASFMAYKHYSQ